MAAKKKITKKTTKKSSKAKSSSKKAPALPKRPKEPTLKQRVEIALNNVKEDVEVSLKDIAADRERLKQELKDLKQREKAVKKELETAVISAEAIMPLCKLGSAKAVADFMKKNKIKGFRSLSDDCPLANYLKKQLGGKKIRVSVGSEIEVDGLMVDAHGPLYDFITKFDNGGFPEIDKQPNSSASW
jgi:hypothetical protein